MNDIKLIYYATVKDGLMRVHARKQFDRDICVFNGSDVEITISKKRVKRSGNQNRFYWGVIIPIVKDALFEAGIIKTGIETHELLKERCNQIEYVNQRTGEVVSASGSTTKLTTSGFMDYMIRIKVFVREFLNTELPEPGEVMEIEFNEQ